MFVDDHDPFGPNPSELDSDLDDKADARGGGGGGAAARGTEDSFDDRFDCRDHQLANDHDPFGPNPSELDSDLDNKADARGGAGGGAAERGTEDSFDDRFDEGDNRRNLPRRRRVPKEDDQVAILGTFRTRNHRQVYRDLRRTGLVTQQSVTPATDFLLVPDKHSDNWKNWTKMKDAMEYGTQVIDEQDLRVLGWRDWPSL